MLRVTHPNLEGEATCVDLAQFENTYAPAGWQLVVDDDGEPVETETAHPTAHHGTSEPIPEAPIPPGEPVTLADLVPDGTVDEVLEWAGDDINNLRAAAAAEHAKGDDARVTLTEALDHKIAALED